MAKREPDQAVTGGGHVGGTVPRRRFEKKGGYAGSAPKIEPKPPEGPGAGVNRPSKPPAQTAPPSSQTDGTSGSTA